MNSKFLLSGAVFAAATVMALPLGGQDKPPATPPAAPAAPADSASAFRRFTTADGKTFYAIITTKSSSSVTFKLQNGKTETKPIRTLSEVDQNFVRKWTKFKDELLKNAEFATITVKDLLGLRGYQSFEFEIEGNHIFVNGELNGKERRFLIDTGAETSLLHDASAKEAGLELGPYDQKIYGVGGEAKAAITKIGTLKVGDAVITNRKILATDLFKNGGSQGHDGLFGADFMRELEAVISYREGRIFLKPDNVGKQAPPDSSKPATERFEFRKWTMADAAAKPFTAALVDKDDKTRQASFRFQNGKVAPLAYEKLSENDLDIVTKWSKLRDDLAKNPEFRTLTVKELLELRKYQSYTYRLDKNSIIVDGAVSNGTSETPARFVIDTGAHGCTMHLGFSKRAGLKIGPMDQWVYGIGGKAPAATTEIKLLRIGDSVVKDRTALSCDLYKDLPIAADKGEYDALFGADFLRELDAAISYKENRIFLRPDLSDTPAERKNDKEKKDEDASGDPGN